MKISKNKIRLYFYIGSIFSIIILTALFYYNVSTSLRNEYDNKSEQLSTGIINEKKRFLENAVNRTIQTIEVARENTVKEYGSELSTEQIDEMSIEKIRNLIHNLVLIDDGYVWVNKIIDYGGGEQYAIREIHPNLPETEGIYLSTETTDIKGNKPYQVELDGINKNGELFYEYYFKKMGTEEIAHKM